MRIEYITHASLFLQSTDCSLLIDPFYYFDAEFAGLLCHFPPRDINLANFGKLNFVYSSHIHPDHSHPGTLALLKDQIETVLLPADRPDLEQRYRSLGFTDIMLLANGVPRQLRPGVEVTSYWDDPVDSVLVVQMDGKTVLHQNDCQLTFKTLTAIAQRYTIDYAFLLYTAPQDIYPLLLPRSKHELTNIVITREEEFLKYQLACLDILQPKHLIPYSFTLTYFRPEQLHFNGYGRFTPTTFVQRLLEQRSHLQPWIVQPGDWIDATTDTLQRLHSRDYWGDSLETYLDNISEFYQTHQEQLPTFEWGDPNALHESLTIFLSDRVRHFFLSVYATRTIGLHVQGKNIQRSYILNLPQKQLITDDMNVELWQKPAMIEIFIPASLLEQLLLKNYDPISVLWSYQVKFKLNVRSTATSYSEFLMYVVLVVSIFYPELLESGVNLTQYGLLGQWSTPSTPASPVPTPCPV